MPILKGHGYTGTVFVVTSEIGKLGYMSDSQLAGLAEIGWEIGSHAVTRRFLTELSDTELLYELSASRQRLEYLGLSVTSFAPPGGRHDARTIAAVAQHYLCQRISWPNGLNDIPLRSEKDRYRLMAVSVEARTTIKEVRQWILKAKAEKKWLILLFHRIDEAGDYNWSSQDLENVVRFAKEQGFAGIPVSGFK